MKNIQAIKVGNTINLSINGKLHKKNCSNANEANELFKIIINAKTNPTDENIKAIMLSLNEKTRIAMKAGLEADIETGEIFLASFNTPIPDTLVDVIKEYIENDYPIEAIINFWKLLMLNPDKKVRTSLFDFIKTHDFVLTDKGYMVVYKKVNYFNKENNNDIDKFLAEFVSNQYLHVKKDWKCSPNKYVVYKSLNYDEPNDNMFGITKVETAETWNEEDKNIEILGKLGDLFNDIFNSYTVENENKLPMYTDDYTHTMKIQLGVPIKKERKECNSDPNIECNNGLHVGATCYVNTFNTTDNIVLACYVNPMNVIAVPNYDHSKIRVSEYFPFALATYENNKIDIIEQAYFETDYMDYEEKELEVMLDKVLAEELPIEKAINAEPEVRNMDELQKIIEQRIVDLDNYYFND